MSNTMSFSSPYVILSVLGLYFFMLLAVGYITGRKANDNGYFVGNRQSLWWMVALGMLSDSMSGVSFISVPGAVNVAHWSYMQVVFGYLAGYLVIAYVLLPLYYRENLTSIYTYLGSRLGVEHQRVGASFFVLSRLLGSAARLFLTVAILQTYLFGPMGVPFFISVMVIIALILAYTMKGGIKTLVVTDALQSVFLIGGVLVCVVALADGLEWIDFWQKGVGESPWQRIMSSEMSDVFVWDGNSKLNFWKQFLGGAAMCIAMTGLDQNMMQKNLSCKSLKDAQKNMVTTGFVVVVVNVFFLSLGVMLHAYLAKYQLSMPLLNSKPSTDGIFPMLALGGHLSLFGSPWVVPFAFVLGLSAATFSSADSVLTTLTTSVYHDFLGLGDENDGHSAERRRLIRRILHFGFAVALFFCILLFYWLNESSLIDTVLMVATYTYGPLLALFFVGIYTRWSPRGGLVVLWCVLAPLITYLLKLSDAAGVWSSGRDMAKFNWLESIWYSMNPAGEPWFGSYVIGFESLIVNAAIVILGLGAIDFAQKRGKGASAV
jgi:Na+/proline symporter